MSVEINAKFITELNEGYPRKNDLLKEGDDHLRLIKAILKNTLPGFNRTVNISSEKLNRIDSLTDATDDTLKVVGNVEFGNKKSISMGNNVVSGISDPINPTDAVNKQFLLKEGVGSAWPVGSIYMSMDVRNPKDYFGFGEWEAFAQGRVIIGVGSDKDDNDEAKLIALGAKKGVYNHKLVKDELAAHGHDGAPLKIAMTGGEHDHQINAQDGTASPEGQADFQAWRDNGNRKRTNKDGTHTHDATISGTTGNTGAGKGHNNMMPYLGVNIWKRVK